MRTMGWLLTVTAIVPIFVITTPIFAVDSPKLAAPVYPGAVPAVLADGVQVDPFYTASFGGVKALSCEGLKEWTDIAGKAITAEEAEKAGVLPGPWCFLTRDPIDKVKSFYDKAIGPMQTINGSWGRSRQPVQGFTAHTERAWLEYDTDSGSTSGFVYTGISLHALPSPPVMGKEQTSVMGEGWEGQDAYKFYAETQHFGGFVEGVDWFGDPSKRKPSELHALYKKYNRLESALFQHKGPTSEPVGETLRARYQKQQQQRVEKAYSGMIPSQAQIQQMQQAAQKPLPANQDATPEDAEFNAFMKKNPKVANKYVELTKKLNTLMQQGKFDEADAVDEELQTLINSHPELAALERRAEERSAAASVVQQAKEDQTRTSQNKQMDQAIWGTWLEYIEAVEKEAFYTLIVIDRDFLRGDEKDYSRDYALITKEAAGFVSHQQVWEFHYDYKQQQGAQAANPAATKQEPDQQIKPKKKTDVKDAAKEGFKALKKIF